MQNFVQFFSDFLGVVLDFLMQPPIFWFVGLFLLVFVIGVLRSILHMVNQ